MTDLVERMAREICRRVWLGKVLPLGLGSLDANAEKTWREWEAEATAAKEAYDKHLADNGLVIVPREPTEAMLGAAEESIWCQPDKRPGTMFWSPKIIWQAMVTARPDTEKTDD